MGYSYGQNERGNWVLSCDGCGNVGGVRKRTCPYKVLGDSLRTGGHRHEMAYCYPPALCGTCYASHGGLYGIHGDNCRTGAARSQEGYDAIEAGLDAGELYVVSACGDWDTDTPAGMVTVTFCGRAGQVKGIVPADDYHPGRKPRMSDYAPALIPA